jgi:hypothetical protein
MVTYLYLFILKNFLAATYHLQDLKTENMREYLKKKKFYVFEATK